MIGPFCGSLSWMIYPFLMLLLHRKLFDHPKDPEASKHLNLTNRKEWVWPVKNVDVIVKRAGLTMKHGDWTNRNADFSAQDGDFKLSNMDFTSKTGDCTVNHRRLKADFEDSTCWGWGSCMFTVYQRSFGKLMMQWPSSERWHIRKDQEACFVCNCL